MDWLTQAKALPAGRKRKIICCGKDPSMIISNGTKGYGAYCFRCGPRGFEPHGMHSLQTLARRKAELAFIQEKTIGLPSDFRQDIPDAAATWLYKAGISPSLIQLYGFGYSERLQRCVLPVRREDGSLSGFVARSTVGAKPKYIERAHPDAIFLSDPSTALAAKAAGPDADLPSFVITEDILSAVRVGCNVPAGAILGTVVHEAHVHDAVLRAGPDRHVAVWLDGDQTGTRAAPKVARSLALQGLQVRIIRTPRDPKYYSNREIRRLLDRRCPSPHHAEEGRLPAT